MEPGDFRETAFSSGRILGLYGGYDASEWAKLGLMPIRLEQYVVVERPFKRKQDEIVWDSAVIATVVDKFPETLDLPNNPHRIGQKLLLIQRKLDLKWEDDCQVLVYRLHGELGVNEDRVPESTWSKVTEWLESHSNLFDLSRSELCEFARFVVERMKQT